MKKKTNSTLHLQFKIEHYYIRWLQEHLQEQFYNFSDIREAKTNTP